MKRFKIAIFAALAICIPLALVIVILTTIGIEAKLLNTVFYIDIAVNLVAIVIVSIIVLSVVFSWLHEQGMATHPPTHSIPFNFFFLL